MAKVIIFGTGDFGTQAYKFLGKENILCFADNNEAKWGGGQYDIPIIKPNRLKECENEYVLVVIGVIANSCPAIENQLQRMNVKRYASYMFVKKYIAEHNLSIDEFLNRMEDIGVAEMFTQLYESEKLKCMYKMQTEFFRKHADINHLLPAEGDLRKLQMDLLEGMCIVRKIALEAGVTPILASGNLIGAVRNQGFIPWDDDVDFHMTRADYTAFINFCKSKGKFYAQSKAKERIDYLMEQRLGKEDFCACFIYGMYFLILFIRLLSGKVVQIDIFPYDFYKEDTKFEEVTNYISQYEKNHRCEDEYSEQYVEELLKHNPYISTEPTSKICYGIEIGFLRACTDFMKIKDLFPLKEMVYEGEKFYAPSNPIQYLRAQYGDIFKWPEKVGLMSHRVELFGND